MNPNTFCDIGWLSACLRFTREEMTGDFVVVGDGDDGIIVSFSISLASAIEKEFNPIIFG